MSDENKTDRSKTKTPEFKDESEESKILNVQNVSLFGHNNFQEESVLRGEEPSITNYFEAGFVFLSILITVIMITQGMVTTIRGVKESTVKTLIVVTHLLLLSIEYVTVKAGGSITQFMTRDETLNDKCDTPENKQIFGGMKIVISTLLVLYKIAYSSNLADNFCFAISTTMLTTSSFIVHVKTLKRIDSVKNICKRVKDDVVEDKVYYKIDNRLNSIKANLKLKSLFIIFMMFLLFGLIVIYMKEIEEESDNWSSSYIIFCFTDGLLQLAVSSAQIISFNDQFMLKINSNTNRNWDGMLIKFGTYQLTSDLTIGVIMPLLIELMKLCTLIKVNK